MFSSIGESLHHRLGADERKQKRRFIIWSCCMITITLIVLRATAISSPNPNTKHHFHTVSKGLNFFKTIDSNHRSPHSSSSSSNAAIITSCKSTLYPAACEAALAGASTKSAKKLFDISIESAKIRATSARAMAYNLTFARGKSKARTPEHGPPTAFDDCLELLDISMEQLDDVIKISKKERRREEDIQTWLSAALTNQVTCSDGLDAAGVELHAKQAMAAQINVLSQYISNALALHASLKEGGGKGGGGGRRLLSDGFPEWVTAGDRKLLEASPGDIRADAVVAKDGSGTHRTIGEAIAFVSLKSGGGGRSVIYVKAGTYREYIKVPTKQKNVMLMGDGKGKSVIIGSHNAENGWSTYESATVAGMGAGFIAKGLTIINDSGPNKGQAVALRVGADQSVIYQCSIQGYQDTLYTLSNRQFYRDCDISGTVDFIFGNSAAVIQNCFIQPRGGQSYITAQGRTDKNQNTGISVQGSRISGGSGGATYLGRPWKQYSRVVFMETEIDGSVNSAGWARWSGNFALSTLYYGEFRNTGAGARTSGRVKWPGVHPALSVAEASQFTVANLINGNSWIPGTGVQYNGGL